MNDSKKCINSGEFQQKLKSPEYQKLRILQLLLQEYHMNIIIN